MRKVTSPRHSAPWLRQSRLDEAHREATVRLSCSASRAFIPDAEQKSREEIFSFLLFGFTMMYETVRELGRGTCDPGNPRMKVLLSTRVSHLIRSLSLSHSSTSQSRAFLPFLSASHLARQTSSGE